MSNLIKNDRIVADKWKTLRLADTDTPDNVRLPVGPLLVPLSVWQARRAELIHREYEHGWPLGVWLSAEEESESIANDIDDFTVIAIEVDQENHTNTRLLRTRYGYKGELRTILTDAKRSSTLGFGSDALRQAA
ncbi:MAG: DUF934 domain-containing protein [Proteobacteria bacterium]|nr:DUF934 domain-containing protein [Pseudomonadota bacterium]